MTLNPLNPLSFPLKDVQLIEASAGTGKTHTIVSLYLRLLLEMRHELDRILVVTFTKAATEELRARIRSLLIEATHFLKGEKEGIERIEEDTSLREMLFNMDDREGAIRRLTDTLARMEEAAIFTIHGFCRRMLQEYAFESGLPFAVEFITEEFSLRREVISDFWRLSCGEMGDDALQKLIKELKSPAGLLRGLDRALNLKNPCILPDESELRGILAEDAASGEYIRFLISALRFMKQELPRRKEKRQILFFDDLLSMLDNALEGDGGKTLSKAIRTRFPVALIDEFQDTDPLQYSIFRKIYMRGDKGEGNGTFICLIGDPKQAIYSFRGADIFAYIQAKKEVGEKNIHTMGTNWRSTKNYVKAINNLFNRNRNAFIYDKISYIPVKAADKNKKESPKHDKLLIESTVPPPLRIRFISASGSDLTGKGLIRTDAARKIVARDCAWEIARLLKLSEDGKATIGGKAIQSSDIAILVRSHLEGETMLGALRDIGIACASLSQTSVFMTDEADELQIILRSVAEPHNERRLRLALATEILGWTVREILELDNNESLLEEVQGRFYHYRDIWLSRGFLPFFFTLLKKEGVPERVRSLPRGERRLTNILHLSELLHVASKRHAGTERLIRWFAQQKLNEDVGEELQLRLESDESLVKITTIHKSKGLEYPIVFFPFPWGCKVNRTNKNSPVLYHDESKNFMQCIDFGSQYIDKHKEYESRESLAEMVRLVYVAVTRARHMCVTWWGPVNKADRSAMARVLNLKVEGHPSKKVVATGEGGQEGIIRDELERLALESRGSIVVEDVSKKTVTHDYSTTKAATGATAYKARVFRGRIQHDWQLASYSSLVQGADAEMPDYGPMPESGEPDVQAGGADPVFLFPRGPVAGACLHGIFENLDFTNARGDALKGVVVSQLKRYGLDETHSGTAETIVERVLDTPLNRKGFHLRNLPASERLNELEFHYPVSRIDPGSFSAILGYNAKYRSATEGLTFESFQGIMKGFIDMVFRDDDRYYIVDYKSNHLGNRFEDYGGEAIQAAMTEHRYHLQYLIYSVALHRYLKVRLQKNYDYARHFGGVYYLFIRGMHPDRGQDTGIFYCLPEEDLIQRLDEFFGAQTGEAA